MPIAAAGVRPGPSHESRILGAGPPPVRAVTPAPAPRRHVPPAHTVPPVRVAQAVLRPALAHGARGASPGPTRAPGHTLSSPACPPPRPPGPDPSTVRCWTLSRSRGPGCAAAPGGATWSCLSEPPCPQLRHAGGHSLPGGHTRLPRMLLPGPPVPPHHRTRPEAPGPQPDLGATSRLPEGEDTSQRTAPAPQAAAPAQG